MAFETKLLTFTANTGIGNQDLTGTTFTPKAAIVWSGGVANTVDAFNEGYTFFYGFTDGTNSRVCNVIAEDARQTSDTARMIRDDSIIAKILVTNTGTIDCQASFVQWLSNGMRINWSNAPASAFKFHVLFFGGSGLTNAAVGTFAPNITGQGEYSYTGLNFQPDFLQIVHDTYISSGNNAVQDTCCFGIGCATSSSAQWSISMVSENGVGAADTYQYQDDSKIISGMDTVGGFFDSGSLVSMNSNGFTISFATSWGETYAFPFLALKGGEYAIGKITEPGSTGNQTITTNTDVKAVQLFGIGTATQRTSTAEIKLTAGSGTSSNEMAVAYAGDLDNADPTATVSRYETTSIYLIATPNDTATSSTIDEEATLDSVSGTGFVINWTNIGGALTPYYATFGVGAQQYQWSINETVSVSSSITRVKTAPRTLTQTVSNSDSIVRLKILPRTLADTLTNSDSMTVVRNYVKTLSDTTSNSDSIIKLKTFSRTLADTVSNSDSIIRIMTFTKSMSDTVSNSDSMAKTVGRFRTTSDTVSNSDSLVRIAGHVRTATDTISNNDSIVKLRSVLKTLSDTITNSDSITKLRSYIRSVVDTVSSSEVVGKIRTFSRYINE